MSDDDRGGARRRAGTVLRSASLTWDGEEGEDAQRDDAELREGEVHAYDVNQDLLGHVGRPEHHEAELQAGETARTLGKGAPEGREGGSAGARRAGARVRAPPPANAGPGAATSAPTGPGGGAGVDAAERVAGPGRETSVLSREAQPDRSPAPPVQGERVNLSFAARAQ